MPFTVTCVWKLLEPTLEEHMWLISVRWGMYDIMSRQRKSINYIICSSSGAPEIIICVQNKTKRTLFTLSAPGRAWLPTRQALLKVTVVRTLPWARCTVGPDRLSASEQVRTPRQTKPRNYRNLPTACRLLLLVCDGRSASDIPAPSNTAKFTTLGLMFTSWERRASRPQFLCLLKLCC